MRLRLWVFLLACQIAGAAVPSHFGEKLESALLCRSEWSTGYWRAYLRQHFGQPVRVWGEAEWFAVDGAEVAGMQIKEVFINQTDSAALMLGAMLNQPDEQVAKDLLARRGIAFKPLPNGRLISNTGSVLVPIPDREKPKTKWYCARWNLGNRP